MTKERIINTKFWDDPYITDLDPTEKLIYIYLLTNPLSNIAGIYELLIKRIASDTGIDKEMILKIFERFERDNKIYYKNNFVFVRNFIKHQRISNPKIKRGIENVFNALPLEIRDFCHSKWAIYGYPMDSLRIGNVYPIHSISQVKRREVKVREEKRREVKVKEPEIEPLPFTFLNFSSFTLPDLQKAITEAVEYYCNINLTASELTRLINIVTKTKQVKKETAWNYVVTELQNFSQYPEDKKNMKYLCAKIEGKINDQLTKLREIKTKKEKQERITENSEIAEKIDFSEIVKSLSV